MISTGSPRPWKAEPGGPGVAAAVPMKIVYLHQYFNTPEMAGATRSFELARRLVSAGHEVHMVTADRTPRAAGSGSEWRTTDEHGITVHWVSVPYDNKMSFSRRIRAFFRFAYSAAKKAAALHGDIVYATSTPLTIAIPAVFASRRNGSPLVFEVRDLWPAVPIELGILRNPVAIWLARRLERFAYRNSMHVVALAPGMKTEIAKTGYPAERITVIPNGCDVELFAGLQSESARIRERNDWFGDRPMVSYIGTIGRINAVDYFVRLARAAAQLDDEIRFVVVGTGIEEDNVRKLARELDVLDKNFFMLGRMSKTEAAAWCNAATMNIALVTGPRFIWKDATQNKYFDSLAAGRPVASNYDGWQAVVATEAGAAIILDSDDSETAARELVAALRNDEWLKRAGEAARSLAAGQFSRDRHAADLEQVLTQCAGS